MSEVQRFSPVPNASSLAYMGADATGDWVAYTDYQSLQEQLEQEEKEIDALKDQSPLSQATKLADRNVELQSQLTEANKQNHLFERLLVDITRVIFPHFERKDISETANYDTLPLHVRRKTQSLSAEVEELQNQIINARAVLTEWAIHNPQLEQALTVARRKLKPIPTTDTPTTSEGD